jgi:stage II sporulation protein D
MSETEELRLILMTSEGAFTSAELMDMLLYPEKRKGYLYLGMRRSSAEKKEEKAETSQVLLPKSLPTASMPAFRAGGSILEENGYFIFYGKGWGHGVGLSQWGAQALAKEGWTAKRILEHYYPGTAVKRFR